MAKLKVHLEVEGADSPKQALGIAQEVIAMLKTRLKNTEIKGTVKLLCPDCEKPMTIEGREIVCPACVAEWEREFDLDRVMKQIARREREPQQTLEAPLIG